MHEPMFATTSIGPHAFAPYPSPNRSGCLKCMYPENHPTHVTGGDPRPYVPFASRPRGAGRGRPAPRRTRQR